MKKRQMIVLGSVLIAGCAVAAFVTLRAPAASAVSDPRQEAPIVRIAAAGAGDRIGAWLHRHHRGAGAEQPRFSRSRQDRGAACEYR